ncbi:MAG: protocatechuate 4,5-dioxygenase subunit alpha [Gammaproteobacteria bacterium]|nr:protocatechuate 4,5-dioxygenase subunit alpha [Gammaproteobacteria bacterium]
MPLHKPYDDIPGTVVFDSDMARIGYHLNQFCMSLMNADNRERFLADEAGYLDDWPMSAEQRKAVLERDYNAMLRLGGNVYFFAKLFFTDHQSFQQAAAQMTGMSEEEYLQMMLSGGRPPEGNLYKDSS